MNKSIIASLMIPVLLTGCGSSSSSNSGTTPEPAIPTTYKWQVVQLKSELAAKVATGCVIYADSDLHEGEVITAYIATADYNILYHNADGTIATTIAASDLDNGLLTIDVDDVPDQGYVTLEELSDPRGGDTGSYMFSVQKALLSDMVVNIAQDQLGTCYLGEDHREVASHTALVNVRQPSSDPAYYQSSYDQDSIDGLTTTADIPVDSPYPATRDILITAFDNYDTDTDQKTELSNWAFIASGNVYQDETDLGYSMTAPLSDTELTDVYWSSLESINLDSASGIIAVHDNTSYFWQPIYTDSSNLRLAYESDQVSLWSSYFSGAGTDNNWLFESFTTLTNETDINLAEFPALGTVDNVSVSATCSVNSLTDMAPNFCIDTAASFDSTSFDYMRLHIRLEELQENNKDSNIIYQSIYSTVTEEPVVLESSLLDFYDPTLIRAEFNLMSSDADSIDAVQYLMDDNLNVVSVGEYGSNTADDAAETMLYNDINGFVTTDVEATSLYHAILATNTTTLMSSYEPVSDQ